MTVDDTKASKVSLGSTSVSQDRRLKHCAEVMMEPQILKPSCKVLRDTSLTSCLQIPDVLLAGSDVEA